MKEKPMNGNDRMPAPNGEICMIAGTIGEDPAFPEGLRLEFNTDTKRCQDDLQTA